ncbi:MAG: tRNA lysidine(34) synthetase TilS [Candidatus Hinthialibacter sp.]
MAGALSFKFLQTIQIHLEQTPEWESAPRKILIAFSGGPDSTALLDALYNLREACQLELCICHINHGLRGKESEEDEAFVREWTDRYHLPLTIRRLDAREIRKIHQGNLEETARDLRYQKLVQTAVDQKCTHIATGHTRSDQAETVLQRILRSTGVTGLSGILPVRLDYSVPIIRPLLEFDREEILRYIEENQLSYRCDSMNEDSHYSRVYIRKTLMPLLKKQFNPQIDEALYQLANIAQEDELFWQSYLEKLIEQVGPARESEPADRQKFLQLSLAEKTRLLRAYGKRLRIDLSRTKITNAINLLESERPQAEIHLDAHNYLYRRYDDFYFAPPLGSHEITREFPIQAPGVTDIFDLNIRVETAVTPMHVHPINFSTGLSAQFDADKVRDPIIIRTRRDGDVIQPLGMDGVKKIKKIFQEKRVTIDDRCRIPLLCFDGDIAWAAGLCLSETYRIDDTTQNILHVTIHPLELD